MSSSIYLCFRCGGKGCITVRVGYKDKQHTEADLCNMCYNLWIQKYAMHDAYRKYAENLLKQQELLVQNSFLQFLEEHKQPERLSEKTPIKEMR